MYRSLLKTKVGRQGIFELSTLREYMSSLNLIAIFMKYQESTCQPNQLLWKNILRILWGTAWSQVLMYFTEGPQRHKKNKMITYQPIMSLFPLDNSHLHISNLAHTFRFNFSTNNKIKFKGEILLNYLFLDLYILNYTSTVFSMHFL